MSELYNIYLVHGTLASKDILIYQSVPYSEIQRLITEYHEALLMPLFTVKHDDTDKTVVNSKLVKQYSDLSFRLELVEPAEPTKLTED